MRRNQHSEPQDAAPAKPRELEVARLDPTNEHVLYSRWHTHKAPLPCELRLELTGRKLYIAHPSNSDGIFSHAGGLLTWPIPILVTSAANELLDDATAFAKGILEEVKQNGFSWSFNLQADLMVAEIGKLCNRRWRPDQIVKMP